MQNLIFQALEGSGDTAATVDKLGRRVGVQLHYRAAAQQYQGFLKIHRCEDLVQLIKEVYLKGQEQAKAGKKPSKVDQEFRKRAETLLHGELSAALGIPVEEIPEYITRRIQSAEAARGCAV